VHNAVNTPSKNMCTSYKEYVNINDNDSSSVYVNSGKKINNNTNHDMKENYNIFKTGVNNHIDVECNMGVNIISESCEGATGDQAECACADEIPGGENKPLRGCN
jgi:hypothetical protein